MRVGPCSGYIGVHINEKGYGLQTVTVCRLSLSTVKGPPHHATCTSILHHFLDQESIISITYSVPCVDLEYSI